MTLGSLTGGIKSKTVALCKCGCGQPAPIATRTRTMYGHYKGYPLDYINGHSARHVRQSVFPGDQFGKLTVIEQAGTKRYGKSSNRVWRCQCECGNVIEALTQELTGGKKRKCNKGCRAQRKTMQTAKRAPFARAKGKARIPIKTPAWQVRLRERNRARGELADNPSAQEIEKIEAHIRAEARAKRDTLILNAPFYFANECECERPLFLNGSGNCYHCGKARLHD